jgi:hypothetical protein
METLFASPDKLIAGLLRLVAQGRFPLRRREQARNIEVDLINQRQGLPLRPGTSSTATTPQRRQSTRCMCSEALHIVDRFHIVAKMNKALDEVRAGESRRKAMGGRTPALKKPRWLPLKREENLKTE